VCAAPAPPTSSSPSSSPPSPHPGNVSELCGAVFAFFADFVCRSSPRPWLFIITFQYMFIRTLLHAHKTCPHMCKINIQIPDKQPRQHALSHTHSTVHLHPHLHVHTRVEIKIKYRTNSLWSKHRLEARQGWKKEGCLSRRSRRFERPVAFFYVLQICKRLCMGVK